jgi:anti-anti-sigma factor
MEHHFLRDRRFFPSHSDALRARTVLADAEVWVSPIGELDLANAPELAALLEYVRPRRPGIVIDLHETIFIDCAIVQVLEDACAQGSVSVVNARGGVRRVLDVVRPAHVGTGAEVREVPSRVDWRFQRGFHISVVREPGLISAQFGGDLDALTAKVLRRDQPVPIEPGALVLDLTALEHVDVSGVREVRRISAAVSACGGAPRLRGLSATVQGMFDLVPEREI